MRLPAVALLAFLTASFANSSLGIGQGHLPSAASAYVEDFDVLWSTVRDGYAYFDKHATDWDKVREYYRPRCAAVTSREQFVALLEDVLGELYDHHAHLNTNTASSPRLVPSGTDLWAEWQSGRALVTQVRPGSAAERAGLTAGAEITAVGGVAVEESVQGRMGKCLRTADPQARNWALRVLLAGRHDRPRRLTVRIAGADRELTLEAPGGPPTNRGLLVHKRVGPSASFAYLRPNNSLGSWELVKEFDEALKEVRDTRGLLLDLRDTPSGGNTTVARAMMGRLVEREAPYQKHALPTEERQFGVRRSWLELVSPRGDFTYDRPVVVLVDHWTGSMGEGITIGLDGLGRAKVVGTRMAGLLGATHTTTLPHSKIGVNYPAEKLFHVKGTPREDFAPTVPVELTEAGKQQADKILEAGIRTLESLIQK